MSPFKHNRYDRKRASEVVTLAGAGYNDGMQDAKEEVRSRLNIEDVIGEYVQLKRSGRNFKGLSPFSGEKTPSFVVSPDKQIWHDFSSGKGGDLFSFVMDVEGLDFRQTLELLARQAGVDLSAYQTSGSGDLAKRKKRLLEANELAATYYQKSLLNNPHALEYIFKKRGLSKKVVQEFRIGYATDSGEALVGFLAKKGFSKQEIKDAGFTNRFGGDLFRSRMMVPLMDVTGQVIGFTGRIIKDDPTAPKYLNTPQTLLYDKSRHVFGLSQAKEAIRKADYAVVVEGNLDVVSSHQVDVQTVVATAGTAMTEYHLKALGRLTSDIKLAFDGDKAGIAATERAIPIAQAVGVELTIITLPEGIKDPDELIQQDSELWQKAIDASEPIIDWVIAQFAKRENIKTPSGKRAFTTAALDVVQLLKDTVEQDHYLTKIADMTDTTRQALIDKLEAGDEELKKETRPIKGDHHVASLVVEPDPVQDALLAVAMSDLRVQDLLVGIDPKIFRDEYRQLVVAYLIEHKGKVVDEPPADLHKQIEYVTMLLTTDVDDVNWSEENRVTTATEALRSLQANYQKTNTKEYLLQQQEAALERGDEAAAKEYLRQLSTLIKGER